MKVIFQTQPKTSKREVESNKREAESDKRTFVLNVESIFGMAFDLNEITVYKQGKPLYINFATQSDADTAKREILIAMQYGEPCVRVSSHPRAIGEAAELLRHRNKRSPIWDD